MEHLRQLIVSVVGHVDHGKSSLLDTIRCSSIVDTEAGKITQAIGASLVPIDSVFRICGTLMNAKDIKIPGLLFIDTPGHAAFTSLRRRGGSLADLAILVVDINEGFKPQTREALEILKACKTPFVIAANKIDIVPGWTRKNDFFCKNYDKQAEHVKEHIDNKLYSLVGTLFESGFQSERFDRLEDFAKQIAIVPCSAKTGEGIPEILMVLIGLAQKFMEKNLAVDITGPARGVVLEIKKIEGLGIVLDTIIYAGILRQGDTILIGGVDKIIKTKAKILQVPAALCEIRDKKTKFVNAEEVLSAAAVRICAPDIEDAIAGMPIISIKDQDIKEAEEDLKKQIEEVMLDTDGDGIVIKADSLGSLEALIKMLREKNIRIKKASIGEITKKDLIDAQTNVETENFTSVILGFNSAPNKEVEEMQKSSNVKIITSDIIYALIEQFERWKEETLKEMQEKELIKLVQPAKLILLSGYVFRQSNPAIVGVEILEGKLLTGTHLMKDDGNQITTVKAMQEEKNSINEAEAGKKIALSLEHVIVGRQIFEGDVFFSVIPESDFRKFKELKHLLGNKEKELLKVIADINRKKDPFWGA